MHRMILRRSTRLTTSPPPSISLMSPFRTKTIGPRDALGAIFRKRRTELGYTLSTVSRATGIIPRYVTAIEEGQYAALPGLVYGKNFVKKYSVFLAFAPGPLLRAFAEEYVVATASTVAPTPIAPMRFTVTPTRVRAGLAFVMVALFLWYVGGEIVGLVRAPSLALSAPSDDIVTDRRTIAVAGVAEPSASVVVNETTVANTNGAFTATVELNPGVNTIVVRAFRRHGRDATLTRRVVRTINQTVSLEQARSLP